MSANPTSAAIKKTAKPIANPVLVNGKDTMKSVWISTFVFMFPNV